jgi:hypothetical protein
MRWEDLFADLDARFEELADEQMVAELADRQRFAVGQLRMVQRFAGAIGARVLVRTAAGQVVAGRMAQVGPDWLLLGQDAGRELVVATRWVTAVEGVRRISALPASPLERRIDLRLTLRGIARDRSPVTITVPGGSVGQGDTGTDLTGTIDRVGHDFLELAQHAPWEPRRSAGVRAVALVPLDAVILARPMPLG